MYHHFEGKSDLARAAIQQLAEQLREEIRQIDQPERSRRARVEAYLAMERQPLRGCRLGRLTNDPDIVDSAALRNAVGEFFGWVRGWLAEHLRAGQLEGEFVPAFDPEELAAVIVATVQGGYVMARAEHDESRFDSAMGGLRSTLASLSRRENARSRGQAEQSGREGPE